MKEFLDALARSLAHPMPRRRALRVFGGALIGLMVPAFNRGAKAQTRAVCYDMPEIPGAAPRPCSSGACCQPQSSNPAGSFMGQCYGAGERCCTHVFTNVDGREAAQIGICSVTQLCAKNATNAPATEFCIDCPSRIICGENCCNAGETCAQRAGMCCPVGQAACGGVCCPTGAPCQLAALSLCCPVGQTVCNVPVRRGQRQVAICCQPGETCCAGVCCSAGQECRRNTCRCTDPRLRSCGTKCCARTETCCGNRECCAPFGCCNDRCCPQGEKCFQGAPTRQTPRSYVCCTDDRAYTATSGRVSCCPLGTVRMNEGCCDRGSPPDCCDLPPLPGLICVNNQYRNG